MSDQWDPLLWAMTTISAPRIWSGKSLLSSLIPHQFLLVSVYIAATPSLLPVTSHRMSCKFLDSQSAPIRQSPLEMTLACFWGYYSHSDCMCAKSLQSCLSLCNCSPPGSSVHGILQARVLKWVAMPSSRGSSWPRDWTRISYVPCLGRWVLQH